MAETNPARISSRRRRFLIGFAIGLLTGIETLGGFVAVNKLDHCDRRGIAIAKARLEDPRIAAVAILVAGTDHLEELLDHRDVANLRHRLPARMQVTAFAERDKLLDHRPQILGLRQGSDDLLVLDQGRRHVGEHGAAMLRLAIELPMDLAVAHIRLQTTDDRSGQRPSSVISSAINNDLRTVWPAPRYCPAASPVLPCRDEAPSGPALPYLVERLAAEIRRPQHFGFRLL